MAPSTKLRTRSSRVTRLLVLALTAALARTEALSAEEGVLSLYVTDTSGRPISGAVFNTQGDGGPSPPTDRSGRTRLRLALATRAGAWVSLAVVPSKGRPDWVFISPWHQRTLVPSFSNESENFVALVLAKRSDRALLESKDAITALAARIVEQFRPRAEGEETTEEERQAILAEQAEAFGLRPDEVDKAIRDLAAKAQDPYQAGIAALYERKYQIADERLATSLELRERKVKEDLAGVAEAASSLGQARFEQGHYKEAAAAYRRAMEIWPERPEVLDGWGISLLRAGDAKAAEAPLREALALRERKLGPEHPETIESLTNIGNLAQELGHYEEAETFYLRAVKAADTNMATGDRRRATALNDLASLYYAQGRFTEAGPLFDRSLKLLERVHGPNHPEVAIALANLAVTLSAQEGRLAEAEPLLQRALAIQENTRGVDHPETATALGYLAGLKYQRGRYQEAEVLFRRVLKVKETILGPDHPELARDLNNLALAQTKLGEYADAEALIRRALTLRERALGADHPDLAWLYVTLADIFYTRGRYADAESPLRKALTLKEKAKVGDNPDFALLLVNLATVCADLDRHDEASRLFKRALGIYEKTLGPEHPQLAAALSNMAESYRRKGALDEAEPLARRALTIREKILGPEHPDVAISLNNLAAIQRPRGFFVEAESLYERALAMLEKTSKEDPVAAAAILDNLAGVRKDLGKKDEAEQLFLRALAVQEEKLGDGLAVATTLKHLAEFYRTSSDPARAESFYVRALAILEKALGSEHSDTAEVRQNYVVFLRAQGRDAEAKALEARRKKAAEPPGI